MIRFLYPQIKKADLLPMFTCALIGALIAGLYGVLHDQITFTISPEYFTQLKFKQFSYADFGLSDRVFVAAIGFLATWWVGLAMGWFLGRRFIPNQARISAVNNIRNAFLLVLVSGFAFGIGGYLYGYLVELNTNLSDWAFLLRYYRVVDGSAFVRVAYIHNASYLGGLLGLICAFIFIRPKLVDTPPVQKP